jgi:peptidylprolyl isomerase
MRIVTVVLPVAVACLTLAGCVSRVGPTAAPVTGVSVPPTRSEVAGECATTDVTVTGAPGTQPEVTLPTDCAPPTTLLSQDLTVGDGPPAVTGSDLEISYVMLTWSDGGKLDSTWSGDSTLPLAVRDLGRSGWIKGLNEGLMGMRRGGRRLIVLPPQELADGSGSGDTLVFVADAETVTN